MNFHPLLRAARARIGEAQGQAIQAGLLPNPQQNSGNPVQLGGRNSTYSAGVIQQVPTAGKLRLDVAAARQAIRQAEFGFTQQRFEVLTAVRQQFYELLAAQQRAETLSTLVGIASQSLAAMEGVYKAGFVKTGDVLQIRIELRRIQIALRNAEITAAAMRRSLAAVAGAPQLVVGRIEGDLTPHLPEYDDALVSGEVLARNAKLGMARASIAKSQFLLRRARVQPIPNLIVQSGFQYTATEPHKQALIGTYFDIPIWDRNQGNIRSANFGLSAANAQLRAAQNELLQQLATAIGRSRGAQQTLTALRDLVLPDARENLRLVELEMANGQTDLFRLLQAQRSLFEANLDIVSAELNALAAAIEIAGLLQQEQFP
ncbi:MAG: TolC family protein [Pirellulales bacterium]|nr:TolC family protein [Pirellulales bacterium]